MLTQAIENLLNRNLPRSPRAQRAVRARSRASACASKPRLGWRARRRIAGRLRCSSPATTRTAQPPDAEISGSLLSLAGAGRRASGRSHPARRREHSRRRRAGAEIPRARACCCKPDVEEELSQAHRRYARAPGAAPRARWRPASAGAPRRPACATWPSTSRTRRGDLVPRAEAEDFYRGVERLREDLDRLEARARLLEHDAKTETPR